MRTFQFSDAKSHKFWSVAVTGPAVTVTFGKVGTAGQTQTKTFATPEKALAEADKLVQEKTKKGYVETTPRAAASEAEAFEAAVRANPHDRTTLSAYADFLAERGDPRGEFMQVQLALEDETRPKAERKTLHAREVELLEAHEEEWVGAWPERVRDRGADHGQVDPTGGRKYLFEHGLLTTVNIPELNVTGARALVAATQTTFVHTLFVGNIAYDEDGEDDEDDEDGESGPVTGPDIPDGVTEQLGQYPLLRWPQLRYVRRFGWGYPAEEQYGDWASHRCWMPGDHVHDFVKQMPDVEELHIFAHVRDATRLVALPMPNLRVFELYHGWSYPLDKLAANKTLAHLTHLHCHPHGLEHGDPPYIRLPHLRAICRSGALPALTHLRLRLTDFGDRGIEEIMVSGLLKRLKVLDLRHGCVTDAGARALAGSPDLKGLALLDLSHNALTGAGVEALRRTGVNLAAEHMHDEPGYDPEADNQYLAHGDPE